MINDRFISWIFIKHRFVFFVICSYFSGYGLIKCFSWLGLAVPNRLGIIFGLLITSFYYVGPKAINRYKGIKAYKLFFPITDEKLIKYRFIYLKNIEQEILYIQQAVDLLEDNDYSKWLCKKKNRLQNIKHQLLDGELVPAGDINFLNKIFNANYYLSNKSELFNNRLTE